MAICKLNAIGFRCQPLPVILAVHKQFIMLLDIANWHLLSYYFNILSIINTMVCRANRFTVYYTLLFFKLFTYAMNRKSCTFTRNSEFRLTYGVQVLWDFASLRLSVCSRQSNLSAYYTFLLSLVDLKPKVYLCCALSTPAQDSLRDVIFLISTVL